LHSQIQKKRIFRGMAEWSIAAVLKTADLLRGPGVRIPLPLPKSLKVQLLRLFSFLWYNFKYKLLPKQNIFLPLLVYETGNFTYQMFSKKTALRFDFP
jgi:hypothetical protein